MANGEHQAPEGQDRRQFLRTAAQVAVTVPAVGLLVAASAKKAHAQINPYGQCIPDTQDFNNVDSSDAQLCRLT